MQHHGTKRPETPALAQQSIPRVERTRYRPTLYATHHRSEPLQLCPANGLCNAGVFRPQLPREQPSAQQSVGPARNEPVHKQTLSPPFLHKVHPTIKDHVRLPVLHAKHELAYSVPFLHECRPSAPRRRKCQALHAHQDAALSLFHDHLALALQLSRPSLKLRHAHPTVTLPLLHCRRQFELFPARQGYKHAVSQLLSCLDMSDPCLVG